jgi:hypothetical protein
MGRNAWMLQIRRSPNWRLRREEDRRLFNAEYREELLHLAESRQANEHRPRRALG